MDAMRELINEQTWNKVKDNVLAFSGLIFGIVVAVLLIAIGKNYLLSLFYIFELPQRNLFWRIGSKFAKISTRQN